MHSAYQKQEKYVNANSRRIDDKTGCARFQLLIENRFYQEKATFTKKEDMHANHSTKLRSLPDAISSEKRK
jgi:hypothetical protein